MNQWINESMNGSINEALNRAINRMKTVWFSTNKFNFARDKFSQHAFITVTKLLTLSRRHADIISKKRAGFGAIFYARRNRFADLSDAQIGQFGQRKCGDHHLPITPAERKTVQHTRWDSATGEEQENVEGNTTSQPFDHHVNWSSVLGVYKADRITQHNPAEWTKEADLWAISKKIRLQIFVLGRGRTLNFNEYFKISSKLYYCMKTLPGPHRLNGLSTAPIKRGSAAARMGSHSGSARIPLTYVKMFQIPYRV